MSPVGQIATLIADVRRRRAGGLVTVGIGGHGGAGKSTLAAGLAAEVAATQIVPTDAFWNGDEFDLVRLRTSVLDELLSGRGATYGAWNWAAAAPGGETRVEPHGVVVIEGVCALHQMFRHDLDVRVWVEAPREVRLERGVARDGEASRATWVEVWMPNEDAYVARDRPVECAHLVVDGTRPIG